MSHTGERAIAGRTSGLIGPDETVTWHARQFGVPIELTSRVTYFDPPQVFVDEQVRGPFTRFRHEHRFEALASGTLMIDEWDHELPFGPIGRIVDAVIVGARMRSLLKVRNAALKREAELEI
jgi:ligand-binding SRPBCC domain-containing protein